MGFNTPINILNDGLGQIEKNPEEFVKVITENMHYGGTGGVGNHANPVQVGRTRHADLFRLFAVHQNTMVEMSPWSPQAKLLMERSPGAIRQFVHESYFALELMEREMKDATGINPVMGRER